LGILWWNYIFNSWNFGINRKHLVTWIEKLLWSVWPWLKKWNNFLLCQLKILDISFWINWKHLVTWIENLLWTVWFWLKKKKNNFLFANWKFWMYPCYVMKQNPLIDHKCFGLIAWIQLKNYCNYYLNPIFP